MVEPNISRLSKDLVLKRVVDTFGNVFSERFNLPFGHISSAPPANMPVLEIRGRDTDLLFRLENGEILHIEFQTVYTAADIWRFSDYNHAVAYHYHARTHTVIIYGPRVVNAIDRLDLGSHIFTIHTRFLRHEQGAASLRTLQAKVARGEALDARDRLARGAPADGGRHGRLGVPYRRRGCESRTTGGFNDGERSPGVDRQRNRRGIPQGLRPRASARASARVAPRLGLRPSGRRCYGCWRFGSAPYRRPSSGCPLSTTSIA